MLTRSLRGIVWCTIAPMHKTPKASSTARQKDQRDTMKFGVNTLIWAGEFGQSEFALLPSIKAAGFDGVELPLFRPASFDAAGVRKALAANDLECTVCAVLVDGLSLIIDDAELRRKTVLRLKDTIDAAAECGATIIAGPMYSQVGYLPGRRRTADEWARAVEGFQALGDHL